jgi:hypothetical protein
MTLKAPQCPNPCPNRGSYICHTLGCDVCRELDERHKAKQASKPIFIETQPHGQNKSLMRRTMSAAAR